MDLTIKTRDFGPLNFWMPAEGGYVFLTRPGRPGSLGDQICKGGKLTGSTLSATPESFAAVCRAWVRAYRKEASVA